MLIFMHIQANAAVEYEIKQNLNREMYKNLKQVRIDEAGQIEYKEEFVWEDEEICFLIVDESAAVLDGRYPQDCPQDIAVGIMRFQQASGGRETFYMRDMRINKKEPAHDTRTDKGETVYYMRGIIRKSAVYSRYQALEYAACLSILIVSGIAVFGGIMFSRRISNSLKEMCRTAEEIGQNMNMSKRMEYSGQFYEVAVLAQANNRMLDRLEETFRQQEQFTSDVAHELRTPIAVMAAQCEYAGGKSASREDYQEAFEVIERQSHKVSAVIARLLELSRLDYDRREIQKEDVDLPEIVQAVCEDLQQKSGDTLQICQKLEEAHAVGDISLVTIAVQNLLTNAVKYSAAGSSIRAATGTNGDMVFVSVKDSGIGISKEDMAHIFKRFYKADKSRNSEGFGLGLPLTMKIAQKHGGTVTAESRLGEGSTFTLLLPVLKTLK